jgi:hypothetical protein
VVAALSRDEGATDSTLSLVGLIEFSRQLDEHLSARPSHPSYPDYEVV